MTPLEVFERHFAALGSGDMEQVLNDYAPDAVAADPESIGTGHAYIRRSYERNLPKFASLDLDRTTYTNGDVVFVSWRTDLDEHEALEGADTFLIRDDLIHVHTFYSAVVRKQHD